MSRKAERESGDGKQQIKSAMHLEDDEAAQLNVRRARAWKCAEPIDCVEAGNKATKRGCVKDEIGREDPRASWDTVGIAFSGGGIRSATFGLGVLQGMASMGLLRCVDYLSTVSGGGYIGAWFAAWVQREGSLCKVVKQLDPDWSKHSDESEADPFCGKTKTEGKQSIARKVAQEDEHKSDSCFKKAASEPEPIRHLREFSNYLTPKKSFFSADTWTLVAIYLRNLLANQLCLLPAMMIVLLCVRIIAACNASDATLPSGILDWLWVCSLLAILGASSLVGMSLADIDKDKSESPWPFPKGFSQKCVGIMSLLAVSAPIVIWLMTPNVVGSSRFPLHLIELFPHLKMFNGRPPNTPDLFCAKDLYLLLSLYSLIHLAQLFFWMCRSLFEVIVSVIISLVSVCIGVFVCPTLDHVCYMGIGGLSLAFALVFVTFDKGNSWLSRLRQVFAAIASGAAGGALLYALLHLFLWKNSERVGLIVTVGPSCLMAIVGLSASLEIVLIGRVASEGEREWWARMNAWCLILAVSWATVFGVSLYGGLGLQYLWSRSSNMPSIGVMIGWLGSGITALMAGRSSKINGRNSSSWLDSAVGVAPYLFLIGLACVMSLAVHSIAAKSDSGKAQVAGVGRGVRFVLEADWTGKLESSAEQLPPKASQLISAYNKVINETDFTTLFWAIAACVSVVLLSNLFVEVNEFSLNAMDANRLIRCYLGASRARKPNDLTGFDPHDDLYLGDLRIGKKDQIGETTKVKNTQGGEPDTEYWGPYPIINTAINLASGDDLAWQERKADSFILTPLWFGSSNLGYFRNDWTSRSQASDPKSKLNGKLGRAVAISGAAANPNMGYHTSPAITALMTLFNVRLGWWFPNPKIKQDRNSRPSFLLKWLLIELFGFTNGERRFVNLSDGGHFDNLGVFELVRRKCRLIIVSDAEADPDRSFHALGTVIRRCRSDLGIDIEMQLDALRCDSTTRNSTQHCVVGTIRYDQVEQSAPVGTLLYIKATLTGDEQADVKQYAHAHPEFPHEPTIDQFFSESQFESYRALGLHSVKAALEETTNQIQQELTEFSEEHNQHNVVQKLVYHLRLKYFPPPPQSHEDFVNAAEPYARLHEQLRDDDRLSRISRELYPEFGLPKSSDDPDESWKCELLKSGLEGLRHAAKSGKVDEIATNADQISKQIEAHCLEPDQFRRELHLAILMIEILENAWFTTDLSNQQAHPLNAGWMNLFRRWSLVPSIRKVWPILRHEFSRDFVSFCEKWAMFSPGERRLIETPLTERERLLKEFEIEWPPNDSDPPDPARIYVNTMRLTDWIETPTNPETWVRYLRVSLADGKSLIAGVVGTRLLNDRAYEFFMWVRPQFRENGIGVAIMKDVEVKKKLKELSKTRRDILLRYPMNQWIGKGRQIAKGRWLSYFDFYDFRHPTTQRKAEISEIPLPGLSGGVPTDHLKKVWDQFEILRFSPTK